MYIEITIDLERYNEKCFDLRLSNYHTVKKMIDLVWQSQKLTAEPREGYWIRIVNKREVIPGNTRLIDAGIHSGDRIEIL
ncbi:EsaB/YukD family protein [Rossellomorea aquimaris]|uniref:Putative ubiquitin-like protein YukD n=1 Tax=Rossellomorea aquimaris TaxID=189382 RepID=A0A366ETU4_9BACI|nr:EsaB/YukD family protein [Rossellomorea aquimaris]RBP04925.1 putative ubiquitin-like protein YukD [Rossellomorea aquimaris]